ncbi:MAG: hypothetical protein IPI97_14160 [Nitrosomonas sp.]|nr:hypothetical protein [Nitrosomonas sp.]
MENNLKNEKKKLKYSVETLETLLINLYLSSPEKILDVDYPDILEALKQSIELLNKEIKDIEDYEELIQHEESWTE